MTAASAALAPRTAESTSLPLFATPEIAHERRPDGSIVLRSTRQLGSVPASIGVLLERWAAIDPERIFLAERNAQGVWRTLSYGEAAHGANAIAQSLLDRNLGPGRMLMVLAENGIDHALIALGAMHVGVPVAPVSTAYARMSQDFAKLKYIFDLVEPGLIYVDEVDRYAKGLEAIGAGTVEIVASRGSLPVRRVTPFSALLEARPTPAVDAALAAPSCEPDGDLIESAPHRRSHRPRAHIRRIHVVAFPGAGRERNFQR